MKAKCQSRRNVQTVDSKQYKRNSDTRLISMPKNITLSNSRRSTSTVFSKRYISAKVKLADRLFFM